MAETVLFTGAAAVFIVAFFPSLFALRMLTTGPRLRHVAVAFTVALVVLLSVSLVWLLLFLLYR